MIDHPFDGQTTGATHASCAVDEAGPTCRDILVDAASLTSLPFDGQSFRATPVHSAVDEPGQNIAATHRAGAGLPPSEIDGQGGVATRSITAVDGPGQQAHANPRRAAGPNPLHELGDPDIQGTLPGCVADEPGQDIGATHHGAAGLTPSEIDGQHGNAIQKPDAVDEPGQPDDATQTSLAGLTPLHELDGHRSRATQTKRAVDEPGQNVAATPGGHAGLPSLKQVALIRDRWRLRQSWHTAEKALTLRAKAICRSLCDGDKEAGNKLYEEAINGTAWEAFVAIGPIRAAQQGIEEERKKMEKELKKEAKKLHVWPWTEATKGLGALSLAAIVGECGDIGSYANPGKVWKRMGLAPFEGKAPAQWRKEGGASSEDWVAMGYSPKRRSIMWNVGCSLIKAGGPYKALYDERKIYEATKTDSKLIAHKRAQRYIEKRLLRALWQAWRGASEHAQPKAASPLSNTLSPANLSVQARGPLPESEEASVGTQPIRETPPRKTRRKSAPPAGAD